MRARDLADKRTPEPLVVLLQLSLLLAQLLVSPSSPVLELLLDPCLARAAILNEI
jgi:hypothetical protein